MSLWTVIPVKPFEEAKTRLSPALTDIERAALAASLFQRTLAIALTFAASRPVLVVTRSSAIIDLAQAAGAVGLHETDGGDLNAALMTATCYAFDRAASSILTVATDLPFLEVADLMMMSGDRRCVIAPDRWGKGTNALFWRDRRMPPFAFGLDSYTKHFRAIEAMGITPEIGSTPGLGFDVDRLDDFLLWSEMRHRSGETDAAVPKAAIVQRLQADRNNSIQLPSGSSRNA